MYNNDYDLSSYNPNIELRTELSPKQKNDNNNQSENLLNINEIKTSNKKDNVISLKDQNQKINDSIIPDSNEIDTNTFNGQSFDKLEFVKIIIENSFKRENNDNNDNNNIIEEKDINDNNKEIPFMKLNSDSLNKMTIKPKLFGKNNILFNEKDGIEKSIIKIQKMDENEKFSCDYKKLDNYYPKQTESIKIEHLTIEDMINNSGFISEMFIKFAYENDIPFLNEGVAILIDCSGYINKENKIFNMLLIFGITNRDKQSVNELELFSIF